MKQPTQRQPGRNRTKASNVGNNFCTVRSSRTHVIGNTDSFGIRYLWTTLDPLNPTIVTAPVNAIASAYEFYRIKSCTVEFIPNGGFSAPGSAQWCYIANPELMLRMAEGTDANRSDIITNEQNVTNISVAAASTKTLSSGRVMSRRWYSMNASLQNTTDDFDRTIQAMFAARFEGPPSSAVTGKLVFHITYEFTGLGRIGNNTLMHAFERFLVDLPDGQFPPEVTLFNRQAGERVYAIKDAPGDGGGDGDNPGKAPVP